MQIQFKKLVRREPRWLASFADLMALLVAFFVMLLSFSEVDSDNFKRNAGPISEAFFQNKPINLSSSKSSLVMNLNGVLGGRSEDSNLLHEQVRLRLMVVLSEEISRTAIKVLELEDRVVSRFNDKSAFASSSRELTPSILPSLEKIAEVLANTKGAIRVEGHTDDILISTPVFRSNWDLSVARAASVVHHLLDQKRIDASRISAMGLADSQPLVPNSSAQNQAINRRVEISLDTKIPDIAGKAITTIRY